VPVGFTRRFPGITGYLFVSEDLRKYRRAADATVPSQDFLNYTEAAAVLGVKTPCNSRSRSSGQFGHRCRTSARSVEVDSRPTG